VGSRPRGREAGAPVRLVLVLAAGACAPGASQSLPPTVPSFAAHHVAPAGAPTGDGTAERPWDLATALATRGVNATLIGGADVAAELDAKRAIDQGTRVALAL